MSDNAKDVQESLAEFKDFNTRIAAGQLPSFSDESLALARKALAALDRRANVGRGN